MAMGYGEWSGWLGEQVQGDAEAMRRSARRVARLATAKRLPASTRSALRRVVAGLRERAREAEGLARDFNRAEDEGGL